VKLEEMDKWLIAGIAILLTLAFFKSGIVSKLFSIVQPYATGCYVKNIYIANPIIEKPMNKTLKINYEIRFEGHGSEYCWNWVRSYYPSGYTVILIDDNIVKKQRLYDYASCTWSNACDFGYGVDVDLTNVSKGLHNLTIYVFMPSRGCYIDTSKCGMQRVIPYPVPEDWKKYGGEGKRCLGIGEYLDGMNWEQIVKDIRSGNFTKLEYFRIEEFSNIKFLVCEYGECVEPKIIEKPVEKKVIVEKPFIPAYVYVIIGILIVVIIYLVLRRK
jgi:hypothetical protein